jgi:hypothetical protein
LPKNSHVRKHEKIKFAPFYAPPTPHTVERFYPPYRHPEIQTNRKTDKKTNRQTDKKTDRQTIKKSNRQTDRHVTES